MTDEIRFEGEEQRGDLEGMASMLRNTEAKGELVQEQHHNCEFDDSSFEALSRRVAEVERRYLGDSMIAAYFLDHARACAAAGRRFSTYERAEWLRWYRPSDSRGRDIEVNNSDISILARLIVERVPEAGPYVEVRRSKYDEVFEARRASRGA